jgi:hypothetical protein
LKADRVGREFKIFSMCVLVMLTGFSIRESISTRYIHETEYLRELITELKKDKYQEHNVFVEYDHFPLLFYSDLKRLYHIWNINPEYFNRTKEKYFIVLQPDENNNQCVYYNRRIPELRERCERDRRFFLEYAVAKDYNNIVLESGVRILECN